ncbi:MAG: GNAT family N-acetyltransferase [Bdellovibrio sp.]|nr:GNAT family N-acetyltransferase [Bdellovibrio sp.]
MNELILNNIVFSPDNKDLKDNWERLSSQILPRGLSMEYIWFKSCAEACNKFLINTNVFEIKDPLTDKIVALIPNVVRQETLYRFFPIKALYLMRFNLEYGDHYELLIAPGYYTATIKLLTAWMINNHIDACFLNNMHCNSKLASVFPISRKSSLLSARYKKIPCAYILLPTQDKYGDWSAGKFKRILQYKRKLERTFNVSYLRIENQEELSLVLSRYKIMHTSRFLNKGTASSICSDPVQFNFLERLAHNAFDTGTLLAHYIKLNDVIASVEISFLIQGNVFAYTVAFDESYAQYRIGSIQTLIMIERAIEHGADILDLLQGDEGYKQFWSKSLQLDYDLIAFPKNRYGYFLYLITIFRRPLKLVYDIIRLSKIFVPKIGANVNPREINT